MLTAYVHDAGDEHKQYWWLIHVKNLRQMQRLISVNVVGICSSALVFCTFCFGYACESRQQFGLQRTEAVGAFSTVINYEQV